MPYKKFSDFAEEETKLDGKKSKLDDILNKEILITGYKITDSKYKKDDCDKCLALQFTINDQINITFTGSNVLIGQIEKYKNTKRKYLFTQRSKR